MGEWGKGCGEGDVGFRGSLKGSTSAAHIERSQVGGGGREAILLQYCYPR